MRARADRREDSVRCRRRHFEVFPLERDFLYIPLRGTSPNGMIPIFPVMNTDVTLTDPDTNFPVMNTDVTRTDPALIRQIACMPYILGGFLSIYGD